MKCINCEIKIDKSFAYAIKNNVCPACGENIMSAKSLASYVSLQNLLEQTVPDADIEKIANVIIANFELTQLFRDAEKPKQPALKKKKQDKLEPADLEDEEDLDDDIEFESEVEEKPSKFQLPPMAKEAKEKLSSAEFKEKLKKQWGVDLDDGSDLFKGGPPESDDAITNALLRAAEEKKKSSHDAIISGAGGFRRV